MLVAKRQSEPQVVVFTIAPLSVLHSCLGEAVDPLHFFLIVFLVLLLAMLGIMAQLYSTTEWGCWGVRQPCVLHASVC